MDSQNKSSNDEIDLREVFRTLKKRYKLIVVVTVLALVASVAANTFLLKPVFQTKAVLLITKAVPTEPVSESEKGTGLEGLMDSLSSITPMTINTYVGQLESEAVMSRVIKKLKLDRQGYTPSSLAGLVTVTPVQDTSLIDVRVAHSNPFTAQKIANSISEEFLDFISQVNEEQMGKSVEFLKKQAESANKELDKARENLETLQENAAGVAVLEQVAAAKTQDLLNAQSGLLQARAEYQGLLAGVAQARTQLSAIPATNEINNGQAESGSPEVAEPNPAYIDLKAKIDQKLIDAAQKGAEASSLEGTAVRLEAQLKDLQVEMVGKKSAIDLAQKEVTRLEGTNSLIKTKINEAQVAKSLKLGETSLTIVSPASIPTHPVKPNKMLNIAVAVVLGLMVSVALAFLLNYMDNTMKNPQEVEDYIGLPVLAQVPVYKPYKGNGAIPVAEVFGQRLKM